jgi:L-seryl-tRNA(Ser) seleniumtransferase
MERSELEKALMMPQHASDTPPDPRRALPGVDALLHAPELAALAEHYPRAALLAAARAALAHARAELNDGAAPPTPELLAAQVAVALSQADDPIPTPIINATGVIINTNLGRAPLSNVAREAMHAASGYAALEYDLDAGARGSRNQLARAALCAVTGAPDAVVVNNAAAAVLLILAALLPEDRREVIISRGQLIEIGGGFRIPDVLRQSGARLVEVGTTNRTRLADYAAALTPATGMILAVHPSNFRIVGFTESADLHDLADLAHAHNLPLVHDQGSGCLLDLAQFGLAPEPTPMQSLAAGADVVCFSGDKLLGGPQAGIILGQAAAIQTIAKHPLMRTLRVDKVTLAGLIATLRHYQRDESLTHIPVWQMIALPAEAIQARADAMVRDLAAQGIAATVRSGESAIGGGTLPGQTLPTWHIALAATDHGDLDALARRLRLGRPPVISRILRDHLLLDPRTVPPECDTEMAAAIVAACR